MLLIESQSVYNSKNSEIGEIIIVVQSTATSGRKFRIDQPTKVSGAGINIDFS